MKRVNFHLTDRQIDRLKILSNKTGLKVAELIRQALERFLFGKDKIK